MHSLISFTRNHSSVFNSSLTIFCLPLLWQGRTKVSGPVGCVMATVYVRASHMAWLPSFAHLYEPRWPPSAVSRAMARCCVTACPTAQLVLAEASYSTSTLMERVQRRRRACFAVARSSAACSDCANRTHVPRFPASAARQTATPP